MENLGFTFIRIDPDQDPDADLDPDVENAQNINYINKSSVKLAEKIFTRKVFQRIIELDVKDF